MFTKIVACTAGSKSVDVFSASIYTYNPECELLLYEVPNSTFGEAYNSALWIAFQLCDELIVSNDDVVLTPTSVSLLLEDVRNLKKQHGSKLGFVASLADDARNSQNIRYEKGDAPKRVEVVSPIFAWMSKDMFDAAKFPPLNWYSDDVICEDLNQLGFVHYVSRSYVHHVGSQTVGKDYARLNEDALPWLRANRPEYVKKWWGEQWL